jgi:hypothetical protein
MSKEIRDQILWEVESVLLGPIGGELEHLENNPLDFYTVGVLYPTLMRTIETSDDKLYETESSNDGDDNEDQPFNLLQQGGQDSRPLRSRDDSALSDEESLELTTKFRPSAAGISVLVSKGSKLRVNVSFAKYTNLQIERLKHNGSGEAERINVFKRMPIVLDLDYENEIVDPGELVYRCNGISETLTSEGEFCISIVTRPYKGNDDLHNLEIKTFTIINSYQVSSFSDQRNPIRCIFQPHIFIESESGFTPFEDFSNYETMEREDLNLKLLYRNYLSYALGHGISVNWSGIDDKITQAETKVLPVEKVKGVDLSPAVYNRKEILFMKKLAGQSMEGNYVWTNVDKQLREFIESYHSWVEKQLDNINQSEQSLADPLIKVAKENLAKCHELFLRMEVGINILQKDESARKAFEDANKAMFMQRVLADFSKHRRDQKRTLSNTANFDDPLPNYSLIPFNAGSDEIWKNGALAVAQASGKGTLAKWRPFQLAFLLSQIRGLCQADSKDRETVDLIWFPTGGGKTEAYLGLTAFSIFYRRLNAKATMGSPDNGAGVSVLMRYTLRLLNKQQFERAGILICACDLIRAAETMNYGHQRISNGIWIGGSMTPNKADDQIRDYKAYIGALNAGRENDSARHSPPILSCPCCGNRLIKENEVGRWGYFQRKNFRNRPEGPYLIECTNTKCDFHVLDKNSKMGIQKCLPIYEVDEVIYAERPTLLFSTVDKFVQTAWNSDCFHLFNLDFESGIIQRKFPSPDLIIQDELHLISSALGTIYGVYEIVIDKLCIEQNGHKAKIVGASATVRNAEEQCRRLYARKHFMQFPPPGTDADDSFFAKKIIEDDPKDRMYVGFMTSGNTSSTALIRLSSVLLERIPTLNVGNQELDNYYTLVVYFNALKELGKFRTFVADDIVAYRKLLANHFGTFVKPFNHSALCELSSVMNAEEITSGLDRLEKVTLPSKIKANSALLEKLFSLGIRTFGTMRNAKGAMWKEIKSQEFFSKIGLEYTDDNDVDHQSFMQLVESVLSQEVEPIQIAPATNMISVGVDVPRLNTMIVNGQPKTSSEYIQASSRVGREKPGIVFTFLAPTKNRDRSHYERFKSFHQAYYYYVESSSVTPFSGPALEKVLPTVLIALSRSIFQNGERTALEASHPAFRTFISGLLGEVIDRAVEVYHNQDISEITESINRIKEDFFRRIDLNGPGKKFAKYKHFNKPDHNGHNRVTLENNLSVYNAPAQLVDSILKDHIPTMQTLRNVESSARIAIKHNS